MQNESLFNESLFLAYRRFYLPSVFTSIPVSSKDELIEYCRDRLSDISGKVGLMLSGGMDSAILAAMLPEGSVAYTLDYDELRGELSEFDAAARFIKKGIAHKRVKVTKNQYFAAARELTFLKQQPTVPHDPAIAVAAKVALADGVTHLVTGIGADGRFGGFAHLYADDSRSGFQKCLHKQFLDPTSILVNSYPVGFLIDKYTVEGRVDVAGFLREVGTEGTAVSDSIKALGLEPVNPFTEIHLEGGNGLRKKIIKEAFLSLYGGERPNKKIALPVPYKQWLSNYRPVMPEFKLNCVKHVHGKRRYLVYSVELYLKYRREFGRNT